jgi:hypothetical protein
MSEDPHQDLQETPKTEDTFQIAEQKMASCNLAMSHK